jgi:hypothetical protein
MEFERVLGKQIEMLYTLVSYLLLLLEQRIEELKKSKP